MPASSNTVILLAPTEWFLYTLECFPTFEISDIKLDNEFFPTYALAYTVCHPFLGSTLIHTFLKKAQGSSCMFSGKEEENNQ